MENRKKIALLTAGATIFGGLGLLVYNQKNHSSIIETDISQPNQEEFAQDESSLPQLENRTVINVTNEKITKSIKEKYNRFKLSGTVTQGLRPLNDVNVEARVARIIGSSQDSWKTKTDEHGKFSLSVPALTSYDLEARHLTSYGSEKVKEVTSTPENDISIVFTDSPDVKLRLNGNDTIRKAILQKTNGRTLEGKIKGNETLFEDVSERMLYNAFIATKNGAIIQDQIPVFDENIEKEYLVPQTVWGQIQVIDGNKNYSIAGAQVKLMLPNISNELFSEELVTGNDGYWQGWITPTTYNLEAQAEGYINNKITGAVLDKEGKLKIPLKQGAVLKGRVIDHEGQRIQGAEVYLLEPLGLSPFDGLKSSTTNNKGEFEIKNINPYLSPPWAPGPQSYFPVAVKEGYIQPNLESILLENYKEENAGLELKLSKLNEKVKGIVVDSNNKPTQALLEYSLIKLHSLEKNISNAPFWKKINLETNPDGSFTLDNMAHGRYSLIAYPENDARDSMKTRQEIIVPTDKKVVIYLNKGINLEGKVFQNDGNVAKQVNLMFTSNLNSWEGYTRTDNQGNFKIISPSGNLEYFAWWNNLDKKSVIEEQMGQIDTNTPQIRLREPNYVALKVFDIETNQPVNVYDATFIETEGTRRITTRKGFDQNGVMYFPLPDQFFQTQVVVQAQGYRISEKIDITKREDQKIDIGIRRR